MMSTSALFGVICGRPYSLMRKTFWSLVMQKRWLLCPVLLAPLIEGMLSKRWWKPCVTTKLFRVSAAGEMKWVMEWICFMCNLNCCNRYRHSSVFRMSVSFYQWVLYCFTHKEKRDPNTCNEIWNNNDNIKEYESTFQCTTTDHVLLIYLQLVIAVFRCPWWI